MSPEWERERERVWMCVNAHVYVCVWKSGKQHMCYQKMCQIGGRKSGRPVAAGIGNTEEDLWAAESTPATLYCKWHELICNTGAQLPLFSLHKPDKRLILKYITQHIIKTLFWPALVPLVTTLHCNVLSGRQHCMCQLWTWKRWDQNDKPKKRCRSVCCC